ncbi:MAG: flavodoxin family protein [Eubacteriaceae bacterium]
MSNNIGIVFFSKDGSTKVLANILAIKNKAKILELIEKNKKSNMITRSINATRKKSVELVDEPHKNINNFNKLYLCTPIWASNGTPAMNAFINNSDFDGKEIVIITVKGFSPSNMLQKTHKYLSDLVESRNGKVVKCVDIHGAGIGKTASDKHIKEQIENLNIL